MRHGLSPWLAFTLALGAAPLAAQPPIDIEWTEITPEYTRTTDTFFGHSTAFDGTTLLVSGGGRIDVYHWDGSAMVFDQMLDPGAEDHPGFGWEAFDVRGDRIIVTDARAESERGAVSFYDRAADGTWSRRRRDVGPCCDNGVLGAGIEFEGDRIAVGAPYFGGGFGSLILLRPDAAGDFAYTPTRFSRFTPLIGNLAGFGVALHGDRILYGSLGGFTAPADSGGAFVVRDTGTSLTEVFRIDNPTPNTQDQFGIDVQMDGRSLMVSARYDDEGARDAGAVHVYDTDGVLQQSILGPEAYARMGAVFDLDGDWMLIGAPAFIPPGVTTESAHLGSVLVYQRSADGTWVNRGRTSQFGGTLGTHFGSRTEIVGNVVVVSANAARVGGVSNAGRVWYGVLTEPDGQPCASDAWCGSGQCVDGICCASACDGACEACAEALTGQDDGTCAPVIDGTDPGAECVDGACGGGTCEAGACTAAIACDGGALDGGGVDGGGVDGGALDGGAADAGPPIDGARADGGAPSDASGLDGGHVDGGPSVPRRPLSCTCRIVVPARDARGTSASLVAVAMLMVALARRRR